MALYFAKIICKISNKKQPIRIIENPRHRLLKTVETAPINHVIKALPKLPKIKSGAAFFVACPPKNFVKRDIFVGKTDEHPNPRIAAPIAKDENCSARTRKTVPAVIIMMPENNTEFSLIKRKNNGAMPRPSTRKRKKVI